MKKVITYGTFDYLHHGHINILKKARELGDYLIVGVTTDDFDRARGKYNVHQSMVDRVEAIKKTGIADEIIFEEYQGQKIEDIIKYEVDVFAIGSDWIGTFDYLKDFCEVTYIQRTLGVSSTDIRSKGELITMGIVGNSDAIGKIINESKYISNFRITSQFNFEGNEETKKTYEGIEYKKTLEEFYENIDSVYVYSRPSERYKHVKSALEQKKHVIVESPMSLSTKEVEKLYQIAEDNKVMLIEGIKTKYSLAFQRMILLVKTGIIGKVKSIDATITSLNIKDEWIQNPIDGGSFLAWIPNLFLPSYNIFGSNYNEIKFYSYLDNHKVEQYTKTVLTYESGVVVLNSGIGVKSEGDLIISGTKGYIYVPAPWWKTDYFEVRKEDQRENQKYFYKLEGEGIRKMLSEFCFKIINKSESKILKNDRTLSKTISKLVEGYYRSLEK